MTGCVDSIETLGLVDGPGIRTVVFLSGCSLRCKYCHNPEMWIKGDNNYTEKELVQKILRNKNYFGKDGGVTFSGGEPLLQIEFLTEVCKLLKKENIHIALDTAGVGLGSYEEILSLVDLVILDIKHTDSEEYLALTGKRMDKALEFIEALNQSGKDVWIRQVVVPGLMDNEEYITSLAKMVKKIKNVQKIEFLPYHKLGSEKYEKLHIPNPYALLKAMDKDECNELYQNFLKIYNNKD